MAVTKVGSRIDVDVEGATLSGGVLTIRAHSAAAAAAILSVTGEQAPAVAPNLPTDIRGSATYSSTMLRATLNMSCAVPAGATSISFRSRDTAGEHTTTWRVTAGTISAGRATATWFYSRILPSHEPFVVGELEFQVLAFGERNTNSGWSASVFV